MGPESSQSSAPTRRDFLKQAGAITAVAAAGGVFNTSSDAQSTTSPVASGGVPWYRRAYRWAQTNITEADAANYDIPWWRQHWKRTMVQGVIINAAGIVAYYPSKYPLQYRPPQLGDRDLYGELAKAAHEDGLIVLARMDSNRVHEDFYRAHPDWMAMNASGQPYRAEGLWVTCINSPYYEQYLPDILREIIERSHPEGFADNSWAGMGRTSVCYCVNCTERFKKFANGKELPRQHNWDDPVYRQWIEWNYARRIELWEFNNRVAREAGGKDCLWIGMNSGAIGSQAASFRDFKQIAERSEIVLLDHQSRPVSDGMSHNALAGKMIHGILGWDKLIPESMPMYQNGAPATFRVSAKPEPEARMWMLSGFAGGIQPWYHHVGAYHEDRRAYLTAEPIMKWHAANEQYLVDRKPMAAIGVVWSQRNTDYYGRDNAEQVVEQPFRGFTQALIRARIPFVPVHIDHIEREAPNLRAIVLPNIGAMSDEQISSVRKFVEGGGGLVASGETSLYDHWGDPRADLGLAAMFGASGGKIRAGGRGGSQHTYLRLTPELRGQVYGPKSGSEPPISGARHPILAGFDQTDILEFGGNLEMLKVDGRAKVLMTFIPAFPTYPPETAWMRTPRTDIPGLIVNESAGMRVAYLPADIDRQFAVNNFPDHGDLLANIVRWTAGGDVGLEVSGRGLLNCDLYRQPGRVILHVVNLTSAGTWRAPVQELIPVGPLQVKIRLPREVQPKTCKMLVAGQTTPITVQNGYATLEIKSVMDHEVLVLEST